MFVLNFCSPPSPRRNSTLPPCAMYAFMASNSSAEKSSLGPAKITSAASLSLRFELFTVTFVKEKQKIVMKIDKF